MICRTPSTQTEPKDGDQMRRYPLRDKQTGVSHVRYTLILRLCDVRGILNSDFRSRYTMSTKSTSQHNSASLPHQDLQETVNVSILTPKPTSRRGIPIRHSLMRPDEYQS